jgi:hypothetical protein
LPHTSSRLSAQSGPAAATLAQHTQASSEIKSMRWRAFGELIIPRAARPWARPPPARHASCKAPIQYWAALPHWLDLKISDLEFFES